LAFYVNSNFAVQWPSFTGFAVVNTWYHLAVSRSGNTFYLFVDGNQKASATSSVTINTSTRPLEIGVGSTFGSNIWGGGTVYNLYGYIDELRFTNGYARYTSSFPVPTSPFTPNNFNIYDQVLDSPTNNFCTLSPIDKDSTFTTSKGNLYCSGTSGDTAIRATHGVSMDKWYWECTIRNNNYGWTTGAGNTSSPLNGTNMHLNANNWFYDPYNGQSVNTSWTSIASSTAAVGDTIMVAIDLGTGTGTGKIWWGKNGTWFASGVPTAGTGAQYSNLSGTICAMFDRSSGSIVDCEINFGQGGQTELVYDAASGGRFKYTPPAGFKALCTANLPSTMPVVTSGAFTGNASADGPFVWLGGAPTDLTINGNTVTWGTHADKLANGFKVRTSSASYNAGSTNSFSATVPAKFKWATARLNP
jgi:hypothetical protein